jgi:phosphoglycerate dehydrogenase-like enzyme
MEESLLVNGLKLLIGKKMQQRYIDLIKQRFPQIEIDTCESKEEQERKLKETDLLFTRILLDDPGKAPLLKWVQFMWEGIDRISPAFRDSDIILTNASGAHAVPIAEHVFTFMLNHERKTFMYREYQQRKEWLGWWDQPKLDLLYGKTLGIIGYGRIGRAIAGIAKGFGMNVLALKKDPNARRSDGLHYSLCCDEEGSIPTRIFGPEGLHEILSLSDHVVLTLPLTEETRGVIGEGEFRKMKEGAYFMNVGRGELVDEHALKMALKKGWISGAGLDVFEKEPLPKEDPLWDMENVTITPHSSVGGDPADDQVVDLFCENLQRFIDGKDMINVIDKKRGY